MATRHSRHDVQRSIEALEHEYATRRDGRHQRPLPASVARAYRMAIARRTEELRRLDAGPADPY